ncbi:sugar ABC transporter permease [Mesorhizobium sp. 8]|uniref:carbohydrate ABC transporter permease n=1 Tax=Mesorhizobium sp. 8 TaxID=2584466 RepID=UPI001123A0DF|nr:sugar ABC transporter permease [Mesorhizobium sp. 8]QDC02203.1 sugar ABC transporter permease [Mesorhizobium sp. 8]
MAQLARDATTAAPPLRPHRANGGLGRRFHLYANSQGGFATLLALPALAVIFAVVLFPLVYSIWLSLAKVDLLDTSGPSLHLFGASIPLFKFVGLANYRELAGDPLYWGALMRTVYFVTAFVVEATVVGLAMALVLNTEFFGRPLLRAALLIPWSMSRVVVGLLWLGMLSSDFGALNAVLHRLGLIDGYIAFFRNGFSALNTLVMVYVWNQAPFATVLFLAGLQSIPKDLYAAAEVDGAGFWRKLWHVTLPSLRPMLFLVLVLSTVNGFLMLDLIFVMTFGGPGNDTTTVSWLGYRTAFNLFQYGPGTAILFTLTAMCAALTVIYRRLVLSKFQAE